MLRETRGDFRASARKCLANDWRGDVLPFDDWLPPGTGIWFLVRGMESEAIESYDASDASQAGPRDPGIDAAPETCP